MCNDSPRARRKRSLLAGGLLVALPLSLSGVPHDSTTVSLGADRTPAPALLQSIVDRETRTLAVERSGTDARIVPVTGPAAQPAADNAQYQQQYQSEVQRQLQLLYNQDGQPAPQMPALQHSPNAYYGTGQPRKTRIRDWFNPTTWKRRFASRPSPRTESPRPSDAFQAPADVRLGESIPLEPTPPRTAAQFPDRPTPAPVRPAGESAAPTTPISLPATAALPAHPQLPRVSPEIFFDPAGPHSSNGSTTVTAPPMLSAPLVATPEQQPRLLPHSPLEAPSPIEQAPQEATRLLIILPSPEATAAAPQAPPAQLPSTADTAWAQELQQMEAEPAEPLEAPAIADEPAPFEFDEQAETAPALVDLPREEERGPFTGLQLEPSPFVENPVHDPAVEAPAPIAASPVDPLETAGDAPPSPAAAGPALTPPTTASVPSSTSPASGGAAPTSPVPAELSVVKPGRPLQAENRAAREATARDAQEKMARIRSRTGLTGFKGFCPVMLKDYRELVDARWEHMTVYQGRQYWFSSAAAKQTFLLDPSSYVPAAGGTDVVHYQRTGEARDGSLDYAVWYRGQLYLFESEATKAAFMASPKSHRVSQ